MLLAWKEVGAGGEGEGGEQVVVKVVVASNPRDDGKGKGLKGLHESDEVDERF